jgi:hypothetical protein
MFINTDKFSIKLSFTATANKKKRNKILLKMLYISNCAHRCTSKDKIVGHWAGQNYDPRVEFKQS